MRVDKNLKLKSSRWSFSGNVAKIFDSHVSKSVPMYYEGHELILSYSDYFVRDNSNVYDIGCSTGELLQKLQKRHKNKPKVKLTGLDIEKNMIVEAKKRNKNKSSNINFLCKDFLKHNTKKSDLIISYYTIQFVSPKDRQKIFDKIFNSLNWGGAVILFEKVRAPDARFQDMSSSIYNDFKEKNGLSSEEILNKTKSLKSVLEPYSTSANFDFLKRSGFKDIMVMFKYVCFEGFIAIK
jgi:tRNA (cmo5U34)-methyltransferase